MHWIPLLPPNEAFGRALNLVHRRRSARDDTVATRVRSQMIALHDQWKLDLHVLDAFTDLCVRMLHHDGIAQTARAQWSGLLNVTSAQYTALVQQVNISTQCNQDVEVLLQKHAAFLGLVPGFLNV